MDFARARSFMVESQIRPADVTDPALLRALRETPRERFAPPAQQALAYADLDLEVAPGRFLLRPRDLAKLLQELRPVRGERGLEIAGATGYGAAIMARAGLAAVTSIDSDPALNAAAAVALKASGAETARAMTADPAQGLPEGAPYDVIWVNGGAESVPEALIDQLADGGRLGVIVRSGPAGAARIYAKRGGATSYRTAFDAAPPVAPGLGLTPAFVF
ncbi:MAG: protein-L-isoaspartate O-methyltransferase [Alphaproteobacteria bacterium]|nr:protein-L-isoaspartate O-methyltransferase [Alphaproteobacteria bacterium]